jgi:hypothetical protein
MKCALHRVCLAAVVASAMLSGCAGTTANFASRSVTDRSKVDLSLGKKISATSSGFQLLFFIPIGINTRHITAYNALLEEAGDGVLADVTVTEGWRYGFVGTVYTTTMEATVYPRLTAAVK